jgi:hypothetical protein
MLRRILCAILGHRLCWRSGLRVLRDVEMAEPHSIRVRR